MSLESRFDPPGKEVPNPVCPVCGEEMSIHDYFYIQDGEVIGCTKCVDQGDPWEYTQEKEYE